MFFTIIAIVLSIFVCLAAIERHKIIHQRQDAEKYGKCKNILNDIRYSDCISVYPESQVIIFHGQTIHREEIERVCVEDRSHQKYDSNTRRFNYRYRFTFGILLKSGTVITRTYHNQMPGSAKRLDVCELKVLEIINMFCELGIKTDVHYINQGKFPLSSISGSKTNCTPHPLLEKDYRTHTRARLWKYCLPSGVLCFIVPFAINAYIGQLLLGTDGNLERYLYYSSLFTPYDNCFFAVSLLCIIAGVFNLLWYDR